MKVINSYAEEIDILLEDPKFDLIAFINKLFPDESSLSNINDCKEKLQAISQNISDSISESILSCSVFNERSESIIIQTKSFISDLVKQIAQIHDMSINTELIISKFCDEIKPLNDAKENLQKSISLLNRLKMIFKSINELKNNINNNNYSECANYVLALNTLFDSLKQYSEIDQINFFKQQFLDLKKILQNKINNELKSRILRMAFDDSSIPICKAIDAFQDDFRSTIIELFCEKFLHQYDELYLKTPLSEINKRYNWFEQQMNIFKRQCSNGFLHEWKMEYHITIAFCSKTLQHLISILSSTPNIKEYLLAFK